MEDHIYKYIILNFHEFICRLNISNKEDYKKSFKTFFKNKFIITKENIAEVKEKYREIVLKHLLDIYNDLTVVPSPKFSLEVFEVIPNNYYYGNFELQRWKYEFIEAMNLIMYGSFQIPRNSKKELKNAIYQDFIDHGIDDIGRQLSHHGIFQKSSDMTIHTILYNAQFRNYLPRFCDRSCYETMFLYPLFCSNCNKLKSPKSITREIKKFKEVFEKNNTDTSDRALSDAYTYKKYPTQDIDYSPVYDQLFELNKEFSEGIQKLKQQRYYDYWSRKLKDQKDFNHRGQFNQQVSRHLWDKGYFNFEEAVNKLTPDFISNELNAHFKIFKFYQLIDKNIDVSKHLKNVENMEKNHAKLWKEVCLINRTKNVWNEYCNRMQW